MRISDWSSDGVLFRSCPAFREYRNNGIGEPFQIIRGGDHNILYATGSDVGKDPQPEGRGFVLDRKSVVSGKSVSVSVDLGGRSIIKKININNTTTKREMT